MIQFWGPPELPIQVSLVTYACSQQQLKLLYVFYMPGIVPCHSNAVLSNPRNSWLCYPHSADEGNEAQRPPMTHSRSSGQKVVKFKLKLKLFDSRPVLSTNAVCIPKLLKIIVQGNKFCISEFLFVELFLKLGLELMNLLSLRIYNTFWEYHFILMEEFASCNLKYLICTFLIKKQKIPHNRCTLLFTISINFL